MLNGDFRLTRLVRLLAVAVILIPLLTGGGLRRKKYENPISKDTEQPDKVLFDKAINDIEHGRYEIARLTLNTLMNTYDTSEYLAKAKLAIADSWYREGGAKSLAQAEAEYKDFILFYPTMEEAAEAQFRVCDLHFQQMAKPDRDPSHALRAEEECRQLLTQFPNSRFAPNAAQRLREIQEVIAQGEYVVGSYYHQKGSFPAAANRLNALTDHLPLFSASDEALLKQGDSYGQMGPRYKQKSLDAYARIVREYPLSGYVGDAKKRLKEAEAEIPEPDPVALARMKYEEENQTKLGLWASFSEFIAGKPDVSRAAKSGQPASTPLRPTTPVSVPLPAGVAPRGTGVTDVTASTIPADSNALDKNPDARQNQNQAAPTVTPPPGMADPGLVLPTTPNNEALPSNRQGQPQKKSDKKKSKTATQQPAAASTTSTDPAKAPAPVPASTAAPDPAAAPKTEPAPPTPPKQDKE